jgi:hypothetical protein
MASSVTLVGPHWYVLAWPHLAGCLTPGVLSDLERAAREYAAAQDAVVAAQESLAQTRANVPVARERLARAIVAATLAGVRQVEVMRVTGYSRESVRRILRAAGVEAVE